MSEKNIYPFIKTDGTEPITVEEFNKLKEPRMCEFFRSYACNNACPNEAIKQLNEQGHKLPELSCSDCSENTGECSDCIFEGSELCPKESEGRFLCEDTES